MSTATPRTPVPHIHRNVSAFPEQGSGRNTGFPQSCIADIEFRKVSTRASSSLMFIALDCSPLGKGYRDQISLPPFPAVYNKLILSHMGKRITMSFVVATGVSLHNQLDVSFAVCLSVVCSTHCALIRSFPILHRSWQ